MVTDSQAGQGSAQGPVLGPPRATGWAFRRETQILGLTVTRFWAAGRGAAAAKLLQSCPTLCDPVDGSPPGSPVLGILLEWVAISFSNA